MKRKAKRITTNPSIVKEKNVSKGHNYDGFGTSMPPQLDIIQIYFDQKDARDLAVEFFQEQQLMKWKTPTGYSIANWKVCAAEWIYNRLQEQKRKLRRSLFSSNF